MAQIGTLDFKGFVESRRGQRPGGREGKGDAYAYASDRNTRLAFERMKPVIVREILQRISPHCVTLRSISSSGIPSVSLV